MKNYRPISLLSHLYKLFTRILQTRLLSILDRYQPREQAGFRKGFSSIDHLHALNNIIAASNEFNLEINVGYIDFEKAFDSVEHEAFLGTLTNIGVNQIYVDILRDIYTDAIAKIHLDDEVSSVIKIERGVRQGDPISPKLFTVALEEVFGKTNIGDKGLNIDGERLSDLRFADDVALISESLDGLEDQLNELDEQCRKIGLKMHKGKTKFMTNYNNVRRIKIGEEEIEQVSVYKYLGQEIRTRDSMDHELQNRIQSGWKIYTKYKEILRNKRIPISLKRKIFDQCILPTVTYGCQTWSLTQQQKKKLRTFQRAVERSMLNISLRDQIPHEQIRRRTEVQDILQYVGMMKWRWAGHVARFKDNRWTKRTNDWSPYTGRRSRGRPPVRWRDDIINYETSVWQWRGQDRTYWRQRGEGFIQRWMAIA